MRFGGHEIRFVSSGLVRLRVATEDLDDTAVPWNVRENTLHTAFAAAAALADWAPR